MLNIESKSAKTIDSANLNANTGRPFVWFKDNNSLLVKTISKEKKELIDTKTAIPNWANNFHVSEAGVKAQNRTYQDLLKNPTDEHNFEQLVLSEIQRVDLNGNSAIMDEK